MPALVVALACVFVLTDVAAAQSGDLNAKFRSTLHGVALDLGGGWRYVHYEQLSCTRGPKPPERQQPMYAEYINDTGLRLFITSWREAPGDQGDLDYRLEWFTQLTIDQVKSEFALGESMATRHAYQRNGHDYAIYVVKEPPRRLELEFSIPGTFDRQWMAEADRIVRTVRLIQPWVDEPRAEWKMVEGRGFRVSYPGDWRWLRPAIDFTDGPPEHAYIDGPPPHIIIHGPQFNLSTLKLEVSVSVSQRFKSLIEVESEAQQAVDEFSFPDFQIDLTSRSLRNHQGRPGAMHLKRLAPGDGGFVSVLYAYEVSPDEVVTLRCCNIPETYWPKIEWTIEEMAACLIIRENQP